MTESLDIVAQAIHLDPHARNLPEVFEVAVPVLAEQSDVEPLVLRRALLEASAESDFLLGSGIALPHVAIPGLRSRAISMVRTAQPIQLGDGPSASADLFFVVAYPSGNPSAHLHFLAHLAGLCRSRVFRDGLRSATGPDEVIALIRAAEQRLGVAASGLAPRSGQQALAIIAVTGERATDAIMMGLLREQLSTASIVDVQNVRDAASQEVPLFAGFRDLFGDPGGRRMIFVDIDNEQSQTIATIVKQACEDDRSASADLVVIPIASRWSWSPPAPASQTSGH